MTTTEEPGVALARLADSPHLLVASDFDGVLAPLVDDPLRSVPIPSSIEALAALAERADTDVAIVSGRERRQLRRLVPDPDRFTLVGSHGAELDDLDPDEEGRRQLAELTDDLSELAARIPGFHIEVKSLSVAAHFRRVDEDGHRLRAAEEVDRLKVAWPGKVVSGKEVVEFTIATANKGDAVRILAQRCRAANTLYLGDDVTDEDAFAALGPGDLGVKVGPGPTAAGYRLDAPPSVSQFLQRLAALRSVRDR